MMAEQTFIILKPDAVQKGIVESCIKRFQDAGLIVKEKHRLTLNRAFLDELYKHLGGKVSEKLLENIKKWMASDEVVAAMLKGEEAVKKTREICGTTNPAEAKAGTIRHDFSKEDMRENAKHDRETKNIIHASGSKEEAEREIMLFRKLVLKK